jgi:hypothetical protein
MLQWLSLLNFIRVTGNRLLFCFNPFTRLGDGSWNSTEVAPRTSRLAHAGARSPRRCSRRPSHAMADRRRRLRRRF